MTKKDYILEFLDAIKNEREPASKIATMVANDKLGEDVLDELIKLFQESVADVKSAQKRDVMQKSIDFLQRLKAQEEKQKVADTADLDAMLSDL